MLNEAAFQIARQEFLAHLRYTKGYSEGTCYGYSSDLKIWAGWLAQAEKDWQTAKPVDVEQFIAWQMRERKVSVHIVSRRISCLSGFYKWAKRNEIAVDDPVYQVEKPKRPQRIPVWLEPDEQKTLEAAVRNVDDIPANIFGQPRERLQRVRRRYEMLYLLILKSGLRISEALKLKVREVRLVDGTALSVRIIGKGNKERIVPLPEHFGQLFGFWLKDRPKEEFVFAQQPGPGSKPPSVQAARSYLRRLREKAGIDKPITPHKLRHTYATRVLETGAELVDIQVLLGHENIATTQMYAHVSEERMRAVVDKL